MIDSPIENLSQALASAQYVDMPNIIDKKRKINSKPFTGNRSNYGEYQEWLKSAYDEYERKPYAHELFVYAMFPQTWSSTALGFGGIGGQAMTDAYTIVIGCNYNYVYCVYFGGRFAYALDMTKCDFNKLNEDIARQSVAEVMDKTRYKNEKNIIRTQKIN